ncbi:aldehyde dehydrogenase [Sistotremastrum niveocremeum HHB9708]|uniref:Aldehyde dehydrogenase n=1 Tax=Sistotremastrum niveocremeum HHB9708 TaxID=1314777 RepID=A0A164ZHK7_9AGAM|nr:aldehyde dehydrogenase [Sistotremastrum niveocremeum HHB9708]
MSTELKYTPIDQLAKIHETLNATFRSGKTLPLHYRRQQLLQLSRLVAENKDAISTAVIADLAKPQLEILMTELVPMATRAADAAKSLEEWTAPEKPAVAGHESWNVTVNKVPKGVALIISPWNYPVHLTISPLIGAIAAGCPAVIKPSENTANTSRVLAELFPKYLDTSAYQLVNGGVPETTELLKLPWDHIFYTGNGTVGRIVATAAAKHLTPITLELGGQCPVIVDPAYDMKIAAKRILFGKGLNAGQICNAPNHVLVPVEKQAELVDALKATLKEFYPNGALDKSSTYGRIINPNHFRRIQGLLKRTQGEIVFGGAVEGERGIEPTIVQNVKAGDSLLEDEIFGPILPIVPVANVDEAIEWVNRFPHALTLYAFTEDEALKKKILAHTNSGGLTFNHTFMNLAADEAPFGGHGASGHGYQHGVYSYKTFTHLRTSLDMPSDVEAFPGFTYAPYAQGVVDYLSQALEAPAS